MAEMTYLEAINLGISEEMARDEKVVIFGEDVGGDKGGVFGVTKGLVLNTVTSVVLIHR